MEIQVLTQNDLDLMAELQPKGWPDILPAILCYVQSPNCFPIKLIYKKKIIGIGTTIINSDTAWLAHIIIHPDYRNVGFGSIITQKLVSSLFDKNIATIYLIATELGQPVYEKIGFLEETEYLFFKDFKSDKSIGVSNNIVPFVDEYKSQILALDFKASGENRIQLIKPNLVEGFAYLNGDIVEGFYLPTLGEGMIVANSNIAGIELMKLRMTTKDNIAFPIENKEATNFMCQNNYKEFKTAKRMRLGIKRGWQPQNIYNRIGGNLG
ncbi:MAG: GNAT family N-acetyltransferase [Bacteroidia bacterium]|nr:GNAT family N-acetyltransferase [Bacteroidia bacterium]